MLCTPTQRLSQKNEPVEWKCTEYSTKGTTMKCPYCNADALCVSGDVIYPHRPDLHQKKFYLCKPCDAYVGCHGTTVIPLGRLANAELRIAKMKAHAAFDPMWKAGDITRSQAYVWLADKLGLTTRQCHIGMFDLDQCKQVVQICNEVN